MQYLLYKDKKPSVRLSVLAALITLPSRNVLTGLARNESHVIWNQQVFSKKFLTPAVCRLRRFERRSVEDFC